MFGSSIFPGFDPTLPVFMFDPPHLSLCLWPYRSCPCLIPLHLSLCWTSVSGFLWPYCACLYFSFPTAHVSMVAPHHALLYVWPHCTCLSLTPLRMFLFFISPPRMSLWLTPTAHVSLYVWPQCTVPIMPVSVILTNTPSYTSSVHICVTLKLMVPNWVSFLTFNS